MSRAPQDGRIDIAIVGGGLCGLAIAAGLARTDRDFVLIEARDRPGGRILSLDGPAGGRFDLGPAWIWPHNRRMLEMIDRHGLPRHPQHAQGTLAFEDREGRVRRDLDFATMGDALRVGGGLARLVEAIAGGLDPARIRLATRLCGLRRVPDGVEIDLAAPAGPMSLRATRAILALPPRLFADTVSILPAPPPEILAALRGIPTWMAGQAKLVACYERPFWREAGMSGDAISHRGPLVEIHDATDEIEGAPALFGFVAPGAALAGKALDHAAIAQLERLFGAPAANPTGLLVKDWSADVATATAADRSPPTNHPHYGLSAALERWAGDRLILSGSETASDHGGYLEGALEAAERALERL